MSDELWQRRRSGKKSAKENDPRNPYEHDYGRVIHSAAFRRLQNKTQVLGLGDSDFYRTRLTHSMEVAQVGAGITTYLSRNTEEDLFDIQAILPEDRLIQAICLAHDIGTVRAPQHHDRLKQRRHHRQHDRARLRDQLHGQQADAGRRGGAGDDRGHVAGAAAGRGRQAHGGGV